MNDIVGFLETPILTPTQVGKARKLYVTVQHDRVTICNHKLPKTNIPKKINCECCWFAFFQGNGDLVTKLDEVLTTHGEGAIVRSQGKKFLHRFKQFMATIERFKKEAE